MLPRDLLQDLLSARFLFVVNCEMTQLSELGGPVKAVASGLGDKVNVPRHIYPPVDGTTGSTSGLVVNL